MLLTFPFVKKNVPGATLGVLLLTACLALPAAEKDTGKVESPIPVKFQLRSNQETLEYNMREVEATQTMREADQIARTAANAYQTGSYKKAIDLYLKARNILLKAGAKDAETKAKIESCQQAISQCYFYWAEKLYFDAQASADVKQFDQAIDNCRKAAEMWPPEKKRMEEAIARFEKMKESAIYQNKVSTSAVIPDKEENLYSIDVLLKQAATFYRDGQWDKARDKYEEVIAKDPYNSKAIEGIRNTGFRMLEAGRRRRELVHDEYIAEVEWKMLSPLVPRLSTPPGRAATGNEPILKDMKRNQLLDKLKNIMLDHISFEEIELPLIIRHLRQRSKELDPEKTGVNIFLVTGDGVASKPVETAAGDAGGLGAGAPGLPPQATPAAAPAAAPGGDNKKYTLGADNIPLGRVLQYIAKLSGYRLKIDDYAVILAAPNVPLEQMERRSYPYEKTMIDKLSPDAFLSGTGTGDQGGLGAGTAGGSASGGSPLVRLNPAVFFNNIPFTDPEAKVFYNRLTSRLIVTNTPENLLLVEENLKRKNEGVDRQVLIQTKFAEVQLNDLEELGFQYLVSRQNSNVGYQTTGNLTKWVQGDPLPEGSINIYQTAGSPSGWTSSNNSSQFVYGPGSQWHQYIGSYTKGGAQTVDVSKLSSFYYSSAPIQSKSMSFGQNAQVVRSYRDLPGNSSTQDIFFNGAYYNKYGYKVNVTVNALDQADSSELLACPRITTLNGYDAVIKMVRYRYLPKSWGEAELGTIAAGGNSNVPLFTPSIPEFGEATQLGINLPVKPTVDPVDNYTISLVMTPSIRQFIGWTDYSYYLTDESAGQQVTYQNILKMPIIENREVNTSVDCFDGETIVLGGVIKDQVSATDDQYPILGTLPIVGRLFQSKTKESTKQNLLIFLTCRLVNPDGSPLREREMRGLPPFRQ